MEHLSAPFSAAGLISRRVIDTALDNLTASPPLAQSDIAGSGASILIVAAVAVAVGAAGYYLLHRFQMRDAASQTKRLLEQAEQDAANKLKQAELDKRERLMTLQRDFDREMNAKRQELLQREKQIDSREAQLKLAANEFRKQESFVEQSQRRLAEKTEEANRRSKQYLQLLEQQTQQLQQISGLSKEQATKMLLENLEKELSSEVGSLLIKHERRISEQAEQRAKDIILTAMQRYASTHTAENTTSTVDIPNDDMKGRIIGREGRNIRAFEKATGCDVIVDDTPGVVIVSGFDPVRREVAKQALGKLIADGRIHPARIEEVTQAEAREMEKFVRRKGEEAAGEVGVNNLAPEVLEKLGRLHFRTSYSQNVLRHSVEVASLAGLMAEMIGLDPQLAKRCGLLHDIGKASDHEAEGGHPKIGAELLKRHGENEHVVHAALGHHDQLTTDYPYTLLVATADACSASRPGARRESLERYIKRMEELESIARSFPGVEQAFAIQAGRELRVIASSSETNDASAAKICRDIARAFEQQLQYPGEIKVTVVRETRFTELAR